MRVGVEDVESAMNTASRCPSHDLKRLRGVQTLVEAKHFGRKRLTQFEKTPRLLTLASGTAPWRC